MLFPSATVAQPCLDFLRRRVPSATESTEIVQLVPSSPRGPNSEYLMTLSAISACIYPGELASVAKEFWQHTGTGVSSRRAEYCHNLFECGLLVRSLDRHVTPDSPKKGPRRYQRKGTDESQQSNTDSPRHVEAPDNYIEERFGRNLDISLASNAKIAIRKRIAGKLTADVDLTRALQLHPNEGPSKPRRGISEDDVYLYPTGMNAIFIAHQTLLRVKGAYKSVCYG
jgi:cystathionine gamma-synthase